MDGKLIDITDHYTPLSSEAFALLDHSEKVREFKRLQWANQRVQALSDVVREMRKKHEQRKRTLAIKIAKITIAYWLSIGSILAFLLIIKPIG